MILAQIDACLCCGKRYDKDLCFSLGIEDVFVASEIASPAIGLPGLPNRLDLHTGTYREEA
ncbi:hypothetical protein GCM10023155_13650 [Bremerella cremea]